MMFNKKMLRNYTPRLMTKPCFWDVQ